jgi:hypothetical protein
VGSDSQLLSNTLILTLASVETARRLNSLEEPP